MCNVVDEEGSGTVGYGRQDDTVVEWTDDNTEVWPGHVYSYCRPAGGTGKTGEYFWHPNWQMGSTFSPSCWAHSPGSPATRRAREFPRMGGEKDVVGL